MVKQRFFLICLAGIITVLIISVGILLFSLFGDQILTSLTSITSITSITSLGKTAKEENFTQGLKEFDALFVRSADGSDSEKGGELHRLLNKLEKKALGVENRLSVLKRRRQLSLNDGRFLAAYLKSAQEAAEDFPHSEPLAAITADALLLTDTQPFTGTPPSERETQEEEKAKRLYDYALRIKTPRFASLGLGLYILSGAMESPEKAALIPLPLLNGNGTGGDLFSSGLSGLAEKDRIALLIDGAALRILEEDAARAQMGIAAMAVSGKNNKDQAAAAPRLNQFLEDSIQDYASDPRALRFAAEYFYDHASPLQAAKLFSRDTSDTGLAREADALALAGEISGARNIWTILAASGEKEAEPIAKAIQFRSLYNLAVTASGKEEEALWLERFFTEQSRSAEAWDTGSSAVYSIIRYTRLLDTPRAMAVLAEGDTEKYPLLDLELLRRRLEITPVARAITEVWLLLGRHPGNETLYHWAAYYFDHQKRYGETARLIKTASVFGFNSSWLRLQQSLVLLRMGNIDEGENLLKAQLQSDPTRSTTENIKPPDWQFFANLARVMESQRSIAAALDYYETAAALVQDKQAASTIQLRISRCFLALGRKPESRRALEQAIQLNPDNLNARHELYRFNIQGIF